MPAAKRPIARLSKADFSWLRPEIFPFTNPMNKKAKAVSTKEEKKVCSFNTWLKGANTKENKGINPITINETKVARPVLSGFTEKSFCISFLDLVER